MKEKDKHYFSRRMHTQLGIIRDMGYNIDKESVILDLGCGNGNLIKAYRDEGYDAYGCDFAFKEGPYVADMRDKSIIRQIDSSAYTLPFDDDSVDFLISDQVFEHVRDYPTTLSEIHRVLKPGGVSLHFFPSRYVLVEPHVHIPFASVIQEPYWLKMWASLGIRTKEQAGLTTKEVVEKNYTYLRNQTTYLTKSEIRAYCSQYFEKVRFCEDFFFKYIKRAPILFKLSKVLFFLPLLYSTMRTRVLFFSK